MPDDPDGRIFFGVALAILYLLCVVYAVCTSYFHNLNKHSLGKKAENGSLAAQKILLLYHRQSEGVYQFGMLFFGLFFVGGAALLFVPSLAAMIPLVRFLAIPLSAVVVLLLAALVFLIFGDLIPKKITAHRAPHFNFRRAFLFRFFSAFMRPALRVTHGVSDLILLLFGLDTKNIRETVTEDEIRFLVDDGEKKGIIEETEKDMIENILEFNDTTASEIMTHRTDLCAAEDTMTIEEALGLAVADGRSRIPVFHEEIDNIQGILYVKDLLPYIGKAIPGSLKLTDLIRPAYFIPGSKKCSQLFSELTEKRLHIAIIVDEYGGTSGLVTIEDLIESIVGNIQDEYDNEEEEIFRMSEDEFTVDGSTSIDEVSDLLGFELPEGDYDTIAGYLTERLGRILKEEDHPVVEAHNLLFTVLEVTEQRIVKIHIKRLH